ncbi:MAG: tetratricopeptide repeat protein [Candidatus Zixiibacteriota bacterium]
MADCNDKKIGDMLPLYELNLLPEADRDKFEWHLFECDYCYDSVKRFRKESFLLNNDPDVKHTVSSSLEDSGKPAVAKPAVKSRRLLPSSVPAIIIALVLIALIIKPWRIEFRPGHEAKASENRLAIMYFNNLSSPDDPRHLGQIVTSLLITDLSESQYVRVVSLEQLFDLLRLLGKEEITTINRETALEIAKKAGAKWILMGDLIEQDSIFSITSQIIDVSSGDILAGQKILGAAADDIFAIVDKLTVEVKDDLSLPAAARHEMDYRVADVTTHSAEAYRYYLEGLNYLSKVYRVEAVASFSKALHYDTTFAMAYYYLSLNANTKYIKDAVKYMENATRREKLYITSRDALLSGEYESAQNILLELIQSYPDEKKAYLRLAETENRLGHYRQGAEYLEKAIALDPLYKEAYNLLIYQYNYLGEIDLALKTIDRYIAIAPDEANPYDTRGEIYARNGMLEEAIESYRMALRKKPDFESSIWMIGELSLFLGRHEAADSMFSRLSLHSVAGYQQSARLALSYGPMRQGKYKEALNIIDDAIAANRLDKVTGYRMAVNNLVKAFLYMELDDKTAARDQMSKYMTLYRNEFPGQMPCYQCFETQILAQCGLIDEAERSAGELKNTLDSLNVTLEYYWYALGTIAMARQDYNKAVEYFETAEKDIPDYFAKYMLAVARMKAGLYAQAADDFMKLQKNINVWRALFSPWDVRTLYYAGLCFDQIGDKEKAAQCFRNYLDALKNTDHTSPEMIDAREKLQSYKNI